MRTLSSLLVVLTMCIAATGHADFTASVDSTEITELDTLQLKLRWSGTDARVSSGQPDFSALKGDFEILSIGDGSGFAMSSVNGRRQRSSYVEWTLSLRPKRLGRLTIAPIRHNNLVSNAVLINVSRLTSDATRRMNQLAFLITSVDKTQVYVQSQLIYTVKFYYRNSYDGDLPLAPELQDVLIKTLVEKKIYQTNVSGVRYFVAEWRYALFPQKSGELTLEREEINGQIKMREGGFFSRSRWEKVRSESEGHHITVRTKPATFTAANWLPARSLTLTESWTQNPQQFAVGEPINRTITVTVQGVSASLLEPLPTHQTENAKVYSDPTKTDETFNDEGILATRIETIGIVPTLAGRLLFPEIRIDWWNTERDRPEVVSIPAASYTVSAAPVGDAVPFEPTVIEPPIQDQPTEEPQPQTQSYWIYVAAALALAWILTTTQWLRTRSALHQSRQQNQAAPQNTQRSPPRETNIRRDITRACRASDPLAARAALLHWAQTHWPEPHIQTLNDLKEVAANDQLTQAITALDLHLFSPDRQQPWNGQPLLDLVNQLKTKPQEKHKDVHAAIPSLYPT